jgi:hypothetical protein
MGRSRVRKHVVNQTSSATECAKTEPKLWRKKAIDAAASV